jgi:hypothetical protein
MDDQAQTQSAAAAAEAQSDAQPRRRRFIVIEIDGEPKIVGSYVELLTDQVTTSVNFYRAMFIAGGKRESRLPKVTVHERQVE